MDETQPLLKALALADKELDAGEAVAVEEVMKEFGLDAERSEPGKWRDGKDDKTKP